MRHSAKQFHDLSGNIFMSKTTPRCRVGYTVFLILERHHCGWCGIFIWHGISHYNKDNDHPTIGCRGDYITIVIWLHFYQHHRNFRTHKIYLRNVPAFLNFILLHFFMYLCFLGFHPQKKLQLNLRATFFFATAFGVVVCSGVVVVAVVEVVVFVAVDRSLDALGESRLSFASSLTMIDPEPGGIVQWWLCDHFHYVNQISNNSIWIIIYGICLTSLNMNRHREKRKSI